MSWQGEMGTIVRHLINDVDSSSYSFSTSRIETSILVAAQQEIARDSRTFARLFGMAHSIVLRELNALVQSTDLLTVTRRDARTMRTHYQPVKSKNGNDRVVQ